MLKLSEVRGVCLVSLWLMLCFFWGCSGSFEHQEEKKDDSNLDSPHFCTFCPYADSLITFFCWLCCSTAGFKKDMSTTLVLKDVIAKMVLLAFLMPPSLWYSCNFSRRFTPVMVWLLHSWYATPEPQTQMEWGFVMTEEELVAAAPITVVTGNIDLSSLPLFDPISDSARGGKAGSVVLKPTRQPQMSLTTNKRELYYSINRDKQLKKYSTHYPILVTLMTTKQP